MSATGYVELKIKVEHHSRWNNSTTMGELRQIVRKEIKQYLNGYFSESKQRISVIGDMKVTVVSLSED